jgi:hypothetical protein
MGGALKRAAIVAVIVAVLTLGFALGRGVVTGVWLPANALVFVAVVTGVVAALLYAFLLGEGRAPAGRPAPPAAVAAREPPPSIAGGPDFGRQPPPARASVRGEPGRTAIVFRQQIPPRHDPGHLSYFGGLPSMPPSFTWPTWTHEGASEPLHFIMQIDCAAVPASARQEGFPAHGVLYFFLDLRWGHSNGYRVLYAGNVSEPLAPARAPADLAAAYGSEARHLWRWARALDDPAARCPNLLPKWPFDPMSISIPAPIPVSWWPEREADVGALRAVLLAAQDDGQAAAPTIDDAREHPMTRPYATYPHDWRAIEIGAGLLLEHAKRALRYASTDCRLRQMTADDVQATSERIGAEVRQWLAQAADHAHFERTPDETREAFWSWLTSWRDFSLFVIRDAATLAIEATLSHSAEAAAHVPAEAIARIYTRHALATRTSSGIIANTPDRMLAAPSYVQGNQEELVLTHLLLLELSSDEGIGHHFGEGVYQFWIAPADLRARRFDRVVLTTDAY